MTSIDDSLQANYTMDYKASLYSEDKVLEKNVPSFVEDFNLEKYNLIFLKMCMFCSKHKIWKYCKSESLLLFNLVEKPRKSSLLSLSLGKEPSISSFNPVLWIKRTSSSALSTVLLVANILNNFITISLLIFFPQFLHPYAYMSKQTFSSCFCIW